MKRLEALFPIKVIAAARPPITTTIARILVNIRKALRRDGSQATENAGKGSAAARTVETSKAFPASITGGSPTDRASGNPLRVNGRFWTGWKT
jgi:hypothetical protein